MIPVANLIEVYGDDIDVDAVAMPCAPLDSRTQTTNIKMMPNKKSSDLTLRFLRALLNPF